MKETVEILLGHSRNCQVFLYKIFNRKISALTTTNYMYKYYYVEETSLYNTVALSML